MGSLDIRLSFPFRVQPMQGCWHRKRTEHISWVYNGKIFLCSCWMDPIIYVKLDWKVLRDAAIKFKVAIINHEHTSFIWGIRTG